MKYTTFFNALNKNELSTKSSYCVSDIFVCKINPFSDAELLKECIVIVYETFFSLVPNGKQILDEVTKHAWDDCKT